MAGIEFTFETEDGVTDKGGIQIDPRMRRHDIRDYLRKKTSDKYISEITCLPAKDWQTVTAQSWMVAYLLKMNPHAKVLPPASFAPGVDLEI